MVIIHIEEDLLKCWAFYADGLFDCKESRCIPIYSYVYVYIE